MSLTNEQETFVKDLYFDFLKFKEARALDYDESLTAEDYREKIQKIYPNLKEV